MCITRAAGACLLALTIDAVAGPAYAQQAPEQRPAQEPPATPVTVAAARVETTAPDASWYGWQMVIGFAGADASMLLSVVAGNAQFGWGLPGIAGWTGHFFIGPVTHWVHGHVGKGFASLGLTLGAEIVGAAAGVGLGLAANTTCHDDTLCAPPGVVVGFFVGGAAGVVAMNLVDVFVLAREEPRETKAGSVALVPLFTPRGGGLAAMGKF